MAQGADRRGDARRATPRAQARLEARGGYLWRIARDDDGARPRLPRRGPRAARSTRSPAASSRAPRSRARSRRAPTCCCSTSPRTISTSSRSNGSSRRSSELDAAVVLVAHDRWFLEAVGTAVLELGGRPTGARASSPAAGTSGAREQAAREIALGKAIDAQQAEIARMERFIERFRYKATKARQAQSRVKKLAKIERIERDPADGRALEFAFSAPERPGRVIFELQDGRDRGRRGRAPLALLERRRAVARARRARLAGRPERHRQDDADRDARRAPGAGGGQAQHGPQREGRLPLPARRRARRRRRRRSRACSTPRSARRG